MKRRVVVFAFVLSFVLVTGSVAWAETMSSEHSDMTDMDMGKSKEEPKQETKRNAETMNPDGTITTKAMGYTLILEVPKAADKGKPIAIVLKVQKGNQPVAGLTPHVMIKSMFAQEGEHKAKDSVDNKMDMGENMDMGDKKSNLDIKGHPAGSGIYRFRWIPDVDGPFGLTFMLDDKKMKDAEITVPIYVKPDPANPYILGAFALFVIMVLSYSSVLRRQVKLGGLTHELA